MKRRSWPEEIDWIREQDQKMYRLINILSVAATLFLVCFISHRAAAFSAESAMAERAALLADASVSEETLRFMAFVSEESMRVEDAMSEEYDMADSESGIAVSEEYDIAALESDAAVLAVLEGEELQSQEEEDAYNSLTDERGFIYEEVSEVISIEENNITDSIGEWNVESVTTGENDVGAAAGLCTAVTAVAWDEVKTPWDDMAHDEVVSTDCRSVRGQPDILIEHNKDAPVIRGQAPPEMVCSHEYGNIGEIKYSIL